MRSAAEAGPRAPELRGRGGNARDALEEHVSPRLQLGRPLDTSEQAQLDDVMSKLPPGASLIQAIL